PGSFPGSLAEAGIHRPYGSCQILPAEIASTENIPGKTDPRKMDLRTGRTGKLAGIRWRFFRRGQDHLKRDRQFPAEKTAADPGAAQQTAAGGNLPQILSGTGL